MSTFSNSGAHILVCPFPASGHIIPLLDLTHQLLARDLTITVLVTPKSHPLLEPLLSIHPSSLHPLVLSIPDPPLPSELGILSIMRAMGELHNPIFHWFQSHPSPPVAIISDFFLGWTLHLANQLSVPRVVFSPSGAFAISIAHSLWSDLPKNGDPDEDENFLVSFPKLPNSPVYPWWQLSHVYRNAKEGDPDWEYYKGIMLGIMASWGLVFNSFTELERVYLDHIKNELGHDRVWTVGPLLPRDNDLEGSTERGGSNTVPSHEVLTWLDQRSDHSVVYVCFGSRHVLTGKQMEVLSAALEHSGVAFIWCVKGPREGQVASDYGVVPDGYEERVEGRGFIIKGWAPQVAILRHRSVGAFVTHCGWNSVLEGLSAGVVMLTWPVSADQFTNAKLLVDQLGVGVRVGEGTQVMPDSDELARLLGESVGESRPERGRARELSIEAWGAVKGGSSERDLDELVKRLSELKSSRGVITSPAGE
ncbi:hypothetical protein L1049_027907 [Liquidambar formosana]|uniref:Uncharacterized protein n=1 Tax=Liquidambar formosana TaxID=63359 RepID=A0AAP0RJL0_LIQFO